MEDASKILSNDAACPVCDQVLSKRSVMFYIGAKGIRNAVQDERNCSSVPAEKRGNARKVLGETGTGAYCISENGQEVSDDGAGN
ncbi:hypothetical protein V6N13_129040 [Hibiscus sabdariffa]